MAEGDEKSFIDSFIDIVSKYSDTPTVYSMAGGYHILSSCVGCFVEMPNLKVSRPNTWFIIASIPGRMRRSTIINYVNYVNKEAWKAYYEYKETLKILDKTKEEKEESKDTGEEDEKEINLKLYAQRIDDGNAPGIADAIIAGNGVGISNFSIVCTEIGDVIRKITNPSSTTVNIDNLLSRLYYGEGFNQKLSTRGDGKHRNIPAGQYVTMFSGMQEPHHYIKEGMSRQGLLRRIKVIYVKSSDLSMKNWKSPAMKGYKQVFIELKKLATEKIMPLMVMYDKPDLVPVIQDDIVGAYITKKARERDEALIKEETDFNIYQQTQWEYECKLAVLDAISKRSVTITMKNIKNIQGFLNDSSKNMKGVIDDLGLSHEQIIEEKREQRILHIIDSHGVEGATTSNLQHGFSSYKHLKLDPPDLQKKLAYMRVERKIFLKKCKDSLGRDKNIWILSKYKI